MNTLHYNTMTLEINANKYSCTTIETEITEQIRNQLNIIHEMITYNIKPNYKNGSFSNTYKIYLHYKPTTTTIPCSILEVYCDYETLYTDMNIIGELYHGPLPKMSIPIHYIFYIIYNFENITYHVAIDTSLKCQTQIQFYIETSYEQLIKLLTIRYNCKKINNSTY